MAITLRDISISDAKLIASWKQDPYIIDMALDHEYQTNEEEQKVDIKRALENDSQEYKMIVKDGNPIGYIRIDWMDEQKRFAWLRFALGTDRRQGYTKMALRHYLLQLFEGDCVRVEGEVYQYNIPSQKLLENLGFKQEGVKRNAHFTGSEYRDVFVYGLLKEDIIIE